MVPKSENSSLQSISREVESELAWLAGIIDGEGCLELNMKKAKNGKRYLSPKVRVYNTDIRMIQKIGEIYKKFNLVFFYTLGNNGKYQKKWKTQMGICVASQGTTKKLLQLIHPYLCNKKKMAEIMFRMIHFVSGCPKGGNTKRFNYCETQEFQTIWDEYETEKSFYIDPSTTTRRANEILLV